MCADLWSLGCFVYMLLVGTPAFKGGSDYLTFKRTLARKFAFPEGMVRLPPLAPPSHPLYLDNLIPSSLPSHPLYLHPLTPHLPTISGGSTRI